MNQVSLDRLSKVHPDLQRVILRADKNSPLPFIITEGIRTMERQKLLVEKGASRTMKSRHLTGHAVDLAALVGDEVRWDWPLYKTLADTVKAAAVTEGVPIEWGGDWRTFKDGPHFQLPWRDYPA
jgi:peptidoglycan L-alanyl-D-glutamate endopeptidase CwlK